MSRLTKKYEDIFFKSIINGFYYKHKDKTSYDEIIFLEPNTFTIHYFYSWNKELQLGFEFTTYDHSHHWVYLNEYDYGHSWALTKEDLSE